MEDDNDDGDDDGTISEMMLKFLYHFGLQVTKEARGLGSRERSSSNESWSRIRHSHRAETTMSVRCTTRSRLQYIYIIIKQYVMLVETSASGSPGGGQSYSIIDILFSIIAFTTEFILLSYGFGKNRELLVPFTTYGGLI